MAGRIAGELERTGQLIGLADPMIAAIALTHGLEMVTGNTAHFQRVQQLGLARPPLVPERSDFLEGDAPAADKVQAFLARALEATGDGSATAMALVPWICDALLSNHSVKAYGRDFMDFVRHMQAQGVTPLEVTADHVKLYKRALLDAGMTSATVARRLSVLRGAYEQLAAKGLVSWETAQDIAAVKAPGVQKNATPSLTQKQAIAPCRPSPPTACRAVSSGSSELP